MIIAYISPRTSGQTTSAGWHAHALHEPGHPVVAFEADYSRQLAEWDVRSGGFPFPVQQQASPLFHKNVPPAMRPEQIGVVDCGHAEDHRNIVRRALATSATEPPQPPSPPVQKFADSHEEVMTRPAASVAGADHDQTEATSDFLGDLASENMLQSSLARVIALEEDIRTAALSGSVNVEHGGLCREIVERLTHAAETLRAATG